MCTMYPISRAIYWAWG